MQHAKYPKIQLVASATIAPDIFETFGNQLKRQLRTEWRIARQAANARIRATRADRDDAKHMPCAWVSPVWEMPRRIQYRPAHRAASNDGGDHDARNFEAERFLKLLDSNVTAFEFRTIDDDRERDDKSLTQTFYGPFAKHAADLQRLNDRGAGVFITINETDAVGRKAENIIRVRAVFVDLDGAPLPPVMAIRSKPHIVVETSPGKFHVYWLVDGMPLQDFSGTQKTLIALFQSDDVIHDLPRVMRLPGFFHRKREPFPIRIYSTNRTPPYPAAYFKCAPTEQRHATTDNKEPATELELVLAAAALEIIPTSLKWKYRNYIGMTTWRATDGHEEGFQAWCRWLERSGQFDAHRARKRWRHYYRSPPDRLRINTLIFLANQIDPDWQQKLAEFWRES